MIGIILFAPYFLQLIASEVQLFVTARQRLNETVSNIGTRYCTATATATVVCYVVYYRVYTVARLRRSNAARSPAPDLN